MKKLLGIFRRTWKDYKETGTSPNKETLDFMLKNPQIYLTMMNHVAIGQLFMKGATEKEDVETAMDIYIHQFENKQPIREDLIFGIYQAFKEYREPKNQKTLGQVFKLEKWRKEHDDPLLMPEDIKDFCYLLLGELDLIENYEFLEVDYSDGCLSKESAVNSLKVREEDQYYEENKKELDPKGEYPSYLDWQDSFPKGKCPHKAEGYAHYDDNFKKYKWDFLNEYLVTNAIVKNNPTFLTDAQRKQIKKYWGIELPELLVIEEELFDPLLVTGVKQILEQV